MPRIESYLRIRMAANAGRLPSGRLGYLSDVTGIVQLWQVGHDGLHDQLTFESERVTSAHPSPVDECWVIARDTGGNERHGIHRLDADAGTATPLAAEPGVMHVPGSFSPDGRLLAFTHNGRNGTDFDVAVIGLDGAGRQEVAQPGGWCQIADWSDHGLLVQRLKTPFDHDLIVMEPGSGAVRELVPHDTETAFDSAVWLADGSVLCACDAGSEFLRLATISPDGSIDFATPDDADVEMVSVDHGRQRRAYTVNRGGLAELWIDGSRVRDVPAGVVGRPWIDAAGVVTLTVAAVDDTSDVWQLPQPRRLTRSGAGGLDRASFVAPRVERFASFDGLDVPYMLFGEPGRPTVCHVHGGPESQARQQLLPLIQYLVARGITVAAPNVRGSTGYGRTYHHLDDVERRLDSVRDLTTLARVLGAGGDVPVAVMGGSYGGYMTLAAITEEPDLWAAAVSIVGIVDFVSFLERTSDYRRALREAEYGSLAHDRELLERLSPIRKVDDIVAPLMVIHGANDPRVPVSEAEQLVAALRKRGQPVEYLRYEDEGHGIARLVNRLDCYPRIASFLESHLGLAR